MRQETMRLGRYLRTALAAATLFGAAGAHAQGTPRLPFFVGERLTYKVQVGRMGAVGHTTMEVDTPQVVRGVPAYLLRFDFHAKVGPIGAVDHTESWLDPEHLVSLRFHKHERHPLSRHDERVELYLERREWQPEKGPAAALASDAPLDELSFMYVLRTLPLGDTTSRYDRHFDAARNPTLLRVVGGRTLTTEAGTFRTVTVEMRVQDPRRYHGEGVIRLDLTDDAWRIPVQIESDMPVVGRTRMTLASQNHPAADHIAAVP
jgi:Protein of unknown function (DUF3108)